MKRKLIMLLASCSIAILIIVPIGTIETGVDKTQSIIQPMIHGAGD